MRGLIRTNWFRLRNEITSVFTVIVSPTVNFRNFARPVTVTGIDWSGPFQGSCFPWVLRSHLPTFENAVEEVEDEQQLGSKYYDHHNTDKVVQWLELVERSPVGVIVIPSWHTGHTFVVHWPEDQVSTNQRDPEVDVTQCIVHKATIHFREPVVNTGKHTEEGRYTHYYVEVRDYEVGIVQVNIDR